MNINGRQLPPRIKEALRQYLASGPRDEPIALADVMRKVRSIVDLEVNDDELADLIAKVAIEVHDRPILFDGRDDDEREK